MINKTLLFTATTKSINCIILVLTLLLASVNIASAKDLNPAISIQPSTNVEVGQEVYLSATGTTYPDATLLDKARYEWDFGDGYYFRYDPVIVAKTYSGIAVTHYFMTPGDHTVTLKVSVWGADGWDSNGYTVGNPVDIETTTTVVHVTGTAPIAGFEIQHANFNNRTKQYLYIQIPTGNRTSSYDLVLSLIDTTASTTTVLLTKNNPGAEEIWLFDHTGLTVGHNYVVQAQILNHGNGTQVAGGIWRDLFTHAAVTVTIDENNSFSVNGSLFFPMTPYQTNPGDFSKYIAQGGVNGMDTEGYSATHTPSTWHDYLGLVQASGLAIGPGRGDYYINFAPYPANRWKFNHNPDEMARYVLLNKDQPAMFAWKWQDEPNGGGRNEKTYTPVLAAWSYVCHHGDPQHPAFNLFMGGDWTKYYGTTPTVYDYLGSAPLFGGKKWTQDIFSSDLYPITQRLWAPVNLTDMGPYAVYLDSLDRIKTNNKNLVPVMPALQPCAGMTNFIVSNDQVYLEAWMNVIHGAKGIVWFNYFYMSTTGRWAAMKKFADQMAILAPVVLGPVPARTVTRTDQANAALNRVDTMIREKNSVVYVFAARITEPDPIAGAKYQGVEPESITPTFTVSGLTGTATATVYGKSRNVSVTNGVFTDTFNQNAVHIYKIVTLRPPSPRNLRVH